MELETFIAYRLPNQTTFKLLKGKGELHAEMPSLKTTEFLFHDFLGDEILTVTNLCKVSETEFKTIPSKKLVNPVTKEAYSNSFKKLKEAIKSNTFKKVILSRIKEIPNSKKALDLFYSLNDNYKNTFNYIISNQTIGTWIGATPERLLSIKQDQIETMSLAGTKRTEENWTSKEIEEQQLVTNTILNNLKEANCSKINQDGPTTIKAGNVEHLHTRITAQLSQKTDWNTVLQKLHPTPAVCGIPTKKAKEYIPNLEVHNRSFYTGYIGLINPVEKHFFVNLRCMELTKDTAQIYVGGGITAPSELELEWRETERKAETLAQIINR